MPRKTNSSINIKVKNEISDKMKEAFPELNHLNDNFLIRLLILDYLGDFSVFEPRYYNKKDLKEIFKDSI